MPLPYDPEDYAGLEEFDVGDLYPQAITPETQPEVAEAIERFRELPAIKRREQPLLWWLLGNGTPPLKASKEDANYADPSPVKDETCGNCVYAYKHVTSGKYICSMMRGYIKPAAWCEFWDEEEG